MAPGITGGFLAGRNLSRKWLGNKTEGRNSTDKAGSVTKASLEQQINDMPKSLFRPGQNCSEVAHAGRVAFIDDAENYFPRFHARLRTCRTRDPHPRRGISTAAWCCATTRTSSRVETLGDFLNGLAESNRKLRIRILDWDFPMVLRHRPRDTRRSSASPGSRTGASTSASTTRIPLAGSHHQKIVAIDDKVAFSGGLDLTNRRWDTPRRTRPTSRGAPSTANPIRRSTT